MNSADMSSYGDHRFALVYDDGSMNVLRASATRAEAVREATACAGVVRIVRLLVLVQEDHGMPEIAHG